MKLAAHRHYPLSGPGNQTGMALAIGMLFLLILTIIGLTAVRSTTQQARMAGNYQFQNAAFQAAESALRGFQREARTNPSADTNALNAAINAGIGGTGQTRTYTLGGGITSTATMVYRGEGIMDEFSLSGKSAAQRFRIVANSTITNTNAQAQHELGLERIGPSAGLN